MLHNIKQPNRPDRPDQPDQTGQPDQPYQPNKLTKTTNPINQSVQPTNQPTNMAFDPASIQPHQLEKIHALSDSDRPDFLRYLLTRTGLQKVMTWTVKTQLGLYWQIALNQTGLIGAAQLVEMFQLAQLGPAGEQAMLFVDDLAIQMYDNSHAFWPDECDMAACKAASKLLFGAVRRYCDEDEDGEDGAAGAIPA